jgi:hypothetical protein
MKNSVKVPLNISDSSNLFYGKDLILTVGAYVVTSNHNPGYVDIYADNTICGYMLRITNEGLILHPGINGYLEDVIDMDFQSRLKIIGVDGDEMI